MTTKLHIKDDVHGQGVDTVACCVRVKMPDSFREVLDRLSLSARACVDRMLERREENSTKFYPELPSVIAKSLIAKYQRNRQCKQVRSLVLPLVGDQGKQIKFNGQEMRIPALFKKRAFPVVVLRPIVGFVRSAEFFERGGEWFASICYNTPAEKVAEPTGAVGVDRNSVGAIATLADPQNGMVLHLGYNPARTKEVWARRKANLQSAGKRRLLHRVRNKQSRRTKHENHVVSKQIVDYAAKHRRCVVLEKLDVRKGRIRRYAERACWSFHQLRQFILYKAALRGVLVVEVDPAYSSQECSRCHKLSRPEGKTFRCAYCGHHDHRDANAAFVLAHRGMPIGGVARESESPRSGLLVAPSLGTEVHPCT